MTDEYVSLEDLALLLVTGGNKTDPALKKEAQQLLDSNSGEGNLTCREALAAHCSPHCAQGASQILDKLTKLT